MLRSAYHQLNCCGASSSLGAVTESNLAPPPESSPAVVLSNGYSESPSEENMADADTIKKIEEGLCYFLRFLGFFSIIYKIQYKIKFVFH